MKKINLPAIREAASHPIATYHARRSSREIREEALEWYKSEEKASVDLADYCARVHNGGESYGRARAGKYRKAAEIIEQSLQERP